MLQAGKFEIKDVPIPTIGPDDILLKGMASKRKINRENVCNAIVVSVCGVCGTDAHIHEGEFISKFPVRLSFDPRKMNEDTDR